MSAKGTYSDPELMTKLTTFRMPFGKHSKSLLTDLPLVYLQWFCKHGYPKGELGQLLRIVFDIKSGGMEHLLDNIRVRQTTQMTDTNNFR
ncbi:MAG: DUF3820 family protein [Gammaproteobacteria bacterium]|jgi:uncharacterized protein (DUF3820 family)